jgi:hypothetical protein
VKRERVKVVERERREERVGGRKGGGENLKAQ